MSIEVERVIPPRMAEWMRRMEKQLRNLRLDAELLFDWRVVPDYRRNEITTVLTCCGLTRHIVTIVSTSREPLAYSADQQYEAAVRTALREMLAQLEDTVSVVEAPQAVESQAMDPSIAKEVARNLVKVFNNKRRCSGDGTTIKRSWISVVPKPPGVKATLYLPPRYRERIFIDANAQAGPFWSWVHKALVEMYKEELATGPAADAARQALRKQLCIMRDGANPDAPLRRIEFRVGELSPVTDSFRVDLRLRPRAGQRQAGLGVAGRTIEVPTIVEGPSYYDRDALRTAVRNAVAEMAKPLPAAPSPHIQPLPATAQCTEEKAVVSSEKRIKMVKLNYMCEHCGRVIEDGAAVHGSVGVFCQSCQAKRERALQMELSLDEALFLLGRWREYGDLRAVAIRWEQLKDAPLWRCILRADVFKEEIGFWDTSDKARPVSVRDVAEWLDGAQKELRRLAAEVVCPSGARVKGKEWEVSDWLLDECGKPKACIFEDKVEKHRKREERRRRVEALAPKLKPEELARLKEARREGVESGPGIAERDREAKARQDAEYAYYNGWRGVPRYCKRCGSARGCMCPRDGSGKRPVAPEPAAKPPRREPKIIL